MKVEDGRIGQLVVESSHPAAVVWMVDKVMKLGDIG